MLPRLTYLHKAADLPASALKKLLHLRANPTQALTDERSLKSVMRMLCHAKAS